jgi:hypothetical protein
MATVGQEDGLAGLPPGGNAPGLIGDYQTNWTSVGGSTAWHGWWDNDDGRWVPVAGAGGDDGLVVKAYVELYASQTQQTLALFHWGAVPFAAQSADLAGTIQQNHPCWVGIRKIGWVQGDKLTKGSNLIFQKDAMGGTTPKPDGAGFGGIALGDNTNAIPITFKINVGTGGFYDMNWEGGVGSANWGWYSPGRMPVGTNTYNFRVTATPAPYQPDGIYELDPQIIVVPDL